MVEQYGVMSMVYITRVRLKIYRALWLEQNVLARSIHFKIIYLQLYFSCIVIELIL